jgi:hypothetical protein
MRCEEVDPLAVHQNRHVPVALRRQGKLFQHLRRVPVTRLWPGGIVGKLCIGHVAPAKVLKGPHRGLVNRELREDRHAVLAVVTAVAPGVGGIGVAVRLGVDGAVAA